MVKLTKDQVLHAVHECLKQLFTEAGYNYRDWLVKIIMCDTKNKTIKSSFINNGVSLPLQEMADAERAMIFKALDDYNDYWAQVNKDLSEPYKGAKQ